MFLIYQYFRNLFPSLVSIYIVHNLFLRLISFLVFAFRGKLPFLWLEISFCGMYFSSNKFNSVLKISHCLFTLLSESLSFPNLRFNLL